MISKLEKENVKTIEAQRAAEIEWKQMVEATMQYTLIPFTGMCRTSISDVERLTDHILFLDSWWNASNIPNKKKENTIYVGGINMYEKQIREKMEGWKGFDITPAAV